MSSRKCMLFDERCFSYKIFFILEWQKTLSVSGHYGHYPNVQVCQNLDRNANTLRQAIDT